VEHVARMEGLINVCMITVIKTVRKARSGDQCVDVRKILKSA
jgi:hypothetical protein